MATRADAAADDAGAIEVRPADRFDDIAAVIGPKEHADANVCWCLTYRVGSKRNRELQGRARGDAVRELTERPVAPGVLAYRGGEVVGWAGVAPRAELQAFANSRKIPHVDDLPVWTVWCLRVRAGHGGTGVAQALVAGAVEFARANGAPAVEGYPVDNGGARVDRTMAYVGTRAMFERAGFRKVADTDSVSGGFPRVVMRRVLA